MEEILKQILSELKGLKEAQERTNERLVNIESDISSMESNISNIESDISEIKVDVKAIKGNEEAIKNFLLNSDSTFRKSEEAYQFIQKFKDVFSK